MSSHIPSLIETPNSQVPSVRSHSRIRKITNADDLDASFTDEDAIAAFDEALRYEDVSLPNDDMSFIQSTFTSRSNSVAPSLSTSPTKRGSVSSTSGGRAGGIELIKSKSDWAPTYTKTKKSSKKKNRLKDKQFLLPDDNSLTFKVLRYPFLIFIAMWLTVLSIVYLIVRLSIYISEQVMANTGQRRKMVNKLKNSKSYPEYIEHAKALNEYLKLDKWCEEDRFYCYDWKTLRRIVRDLRKLRRAGKNQELMIVLQNCVKSNFAGSENPLLYSHTYYGTKNLIVEYNNEVVTSLNSITESTSIPIETKKNFFKTISRSFGKTALALSGGASFCYNHYGVLKALLDNDLLPNIISGTSGGGVISALATTRTNKELASLITPKLAKKINAAGNEPFHVWFRRWWKTGARFDSLDWARKSQWWTLGSMTFKECYERTGKILNISTVPHDIHSPTILCNYITAPDCCIWSTLLASAAVPGILNPVVLMEKVHNGPDGKECIKPFSFGSKWKDGSLRTDIPIEALNTYFNVKFSIVSQVNPHVLLWFFNNKGDIGKPVNRSKGKGYRGGFLSSYLENLIKLESIKWLKLIKEFQLLPNFLESDWSNVFLQKFSGTITLFPKVKIWDYFRLLDDPSEERVAEYITNGQSVTYPKILFIKHRLNIERCIEQGRKSCRASEHSSGHPNSNTPEIGSDYYENALHNLNLADDDDDDDDDDEDYEPERRSETKLNSELYEKSDDEYDAEEENDSYEVDDEDDEDDDDEDDDDEDVGLINSDGTLRHRSI